MRRSALLIILAVAGPLAASAQTSNHLEVLAWQDLCLSTRGNLAEAVRKAETFGWKAPPADEAVNPPEFEYSDTRRSAEAATRQTLMVARHRNPINDGSGLKNNQCMVSQRGVTESPVAAVVTLLGVLPNSQSFLPQPEAEWIMEDRDGRLVQLSDDDIARAERAFKEHRVVMIHATLAQGVSIISYEAPRDRR